jgi:hypothetical protein
VPPWLRCNGLTLAIAALGVAGVGAALLGSAAGAAVGIFGAVLTAVLQIYVRERETSDEIGRVAHALSELGEVARRYRDRIASEPSYGGTSVFEQGEYAFDLHRLAAHITAGRFDFLEGHRQDGWMTLATSLRTGRTEFVGHAGAIGGLPADELVKVRVLGDIGEQAARRAFAVASDYAGYNVDMASAKSRWAGPDRAIDLSMNASYHDLGEDLEQLATQLDRLMAFAPNPALAELREIQAEAERFDAPPTELVE